MCPPEDTLSKLWGFVDYSAAAFWHPYRYFQPPGSNFCKASTSLAHTPTESLINSAQCYHSCGSNHSSPEHFQLFHQGYTTRRGQTEITKPLTSVCIKFEHIFQRQKSLHWKQELWYAHLHYIQCNAQPNMKQVQAWITSIYLYPDVNFLYA